MRGNNRKKVSSKKRNNANTGIQQVIDTLFKLGGTFDIKTLRRSKQSIHPRKFLVSITLPIISKKEQLENDNDIQYLIGRSIYKGCITQIEQTSPKYCSVTFSVIVKDRNAVQNFANMLTKLALDVKSDMEAKYEEIVVSDT